MDGRGLGRGEPHLDTKLENGAAIANALVGKRGMTNKKMDGCQPD